MYSSISCSQVIVKKMLEKSTVYKQTVAIWNDIDHDSVHD